MPVHPLQHVESLNLENQGLNEMPAALSLYSNLNSLNVANNNISTIPDSLTSSLPELKNLVRYLCLNSMHCFLGQLG